MKKIDLFGVAYIDPVIWCELDPKNWKKHMQQKIPQPLTNHWSEQAKFRMVAQPCSWNKATNVFVASHPKLLSKLSNLPVLNSSWLPEILHFTLHLWKTSAKTNWLVCKQLPMQNIVATAQSEHLCQDGWYWRGMVLIWIIRIWFRLSAKALFIWRVFCKKTCPTIQQDQSSTKTVSFHFYPSSLLKKTKNLAYHHSALTFHPSDFYYFCWVTHPNCWDTRHLTHQRRFFDAAEATSLQPDGGAQAKSAA